MAKTEKSYPSLDNLEGKTVDELIALRKQLREIRDYQRVTIDEEITAAQTELRREGINTSELKYQFNIKAAERDHRACCLATDRFLRQSQNLLDYEKADIAVRKAIRDKNGFSSLGFKQRNGNGEEG